MVVHSMELHGAVGGAQFYATMGMSPRDSLRLRYYVRFAVSNGYIGP